MTRLRSRLIPVLGVIATTLCLIACGDIGNSLPLPAGIDIESNGYQSQDGPLLWTIEDSETGRSLVPDDIDHTIDRMFVPDTNWYTPLVVGELIQTDPQASPQFVGYFVLETKGKTLDLYQTWAEVQQRLTDGHVTDLPEINDMRPARNFYWANPQQ